MTRDKDSETTQVTHAGSRADDDDDDRCPSAECGLVGSATLARDLEREEVHESVPLERALRLEESGGPCGAAQPAHSPRAEWWTIPTRSASAEAATEVGVAVSAKARRTYWEVSAEGKRVREQ